MKTLFALLVLFVAAGPLGAQTDVTATKAELAIPFGVATGQLALISDNLVFIDEQDPTQSFAIERANVAEAAFADGVLTVRTKEKIRDRAEFAFRPDSPDFPDAALSWGERTVAPQEALAAPASATETTEKADGFRFAYDVENLRGMFSKNDRGRLIVTDERLTYESVTNVNESEQWDLKDIKEVKRKNPYKLEIVPFIGGSYTFNLLRDGMSTREYKAITDRIADLRAPK